MPNWCDGTLVVEGDTTQLKELMDYLNSPFEREYADSGKQKFSNPVFSFWNVVKPSEDEMDAYVNTEAWWDWNISHWGTKWDIANVDGENYFSTHLNTDSLESGKISYSFATAWSPCSPVVALIAEKFPTLRLTYTFVEPGMDFWGIESYAEGELVSEVGGDTLSHKAYELMGDVEACNCAWSGDEEYFYKDCPKPVAS